MVRWCSCEFVYGIIRTKRGSEKEHVFAYRLDDGMCAVSSLFALLVSAADK